MLETVIWVLTWLATGSQLYLKADDNTIVRSTTLRLARDGTDFQAIIEFISPRFPFHKTCCPEWEEVNGCRSSLSNKLCQALAYGWTGFERGAAIACHAEKTLVLIQSANDWTRIRAIHEHTPPVASHNTLAHDGETPGELLAASIDIVLRHRFTVVVGITWFSGHTLCSHKCAIAINGTCPHAVYLINIGHMFGGTLHGPAQDADTSRPGN